MYDQSVQIGRRSRRAAYRSGRDRQDRGRQVQVRFAQLLICLVLFFAVFLGKGLFPQKLGQVGEDILTLMGTDLDISKALSNLGESLMEGDSLLADLGAFCVEMFGPAPQESVPPEAVSLPPVQPGAVLTSELEFLGGKSGTAVRAAHYADFSRFGIELSAKEPEPEPEDEEPPVEASALLRELEETARVLLHFMNCHNVHPLVCSHDTDRCPAIRDPRAAAGGRRIAAFFNGEE